MSFINFELKSNQIKSNWLEMSNGAIINAKSFWFILADLRIVWFYREIILTYARVLEHAVVHIYPIYKSKFSKHYNAFVDDCSFSHK